MPVRDAHELEHVGPADRLKARGKPHLTRAVALGRRRTGGRFYRRPGAMTRTPCGGLILTLGLKVRSGTHSYGSYPIRHGLENDFPWISWHRDGTSGVRSDPPHPLRQRRETPWGNFDRGVIGRLHWSRARKCCWSDRCIYRTRCHTGLPQTGVGQVLQRSYL
jgi:hypothetical protein